MCELWFVFLVFTAMAVFCSQYAPIVHKPLIGLTSEYSAGGDDGPGLVSVNYTYAKGVIDNGGIPIVLPSLRDKAATGRYVEKLDGLVLCGGFDIPPKAYGQQPHEALSPMDELQYDAECELVTQWWDCSKPMLAICLGMQMVNVVRGGSLIQDIPSMSDTPILHRRKSKEDPHAYHNVSISSDSCLSKIFDSDELSICSVHHQAIDRIGRNLLPTATSGDGIIECIERDDDVFGLFVQWHPEKMLNDTAHRDAIFGSLIRACNGAKF